MDAISGRAGSAGTEDEVIDLRTPGPRSTTWVTASTDVTHVDSRASHRAWRRGDRTSRPVPKGEKHAHLPGASLTACGLSLADLHVWPDQPFVDGLLNRCPGCVRHVRSDLAERARTRVAARPSGNGSAPRSTEVLERH